MVSFKVTMLYALFVLLAVDEAYGLTIITNGTTEYQPVPYVIKDRTSILFQVKACSNVHVLLMANASNQEDAVYELIFGGWQNTKSVIRKQHGGTTLVEDQNPRTACDLFKFFWIDWTDGIISLGEGDLVGNVTFLTYSDPTPTPINHFMISTGGGGTGEWNLGAECRIHGDPHHVMWDGTHYTYGGHRCWFDVLYHDDDFFIKGYYEQCSGQRSCVKEIAIRYKSWDISLQKKNKVKVNNNPVNSFPHVTSDGLITTASDASETRYTYTIELPNAAVIRWDGKKDVQIEVGMSFINSIHGLCGGNYNLDNTDDFILRNGTKVNRIDKDSFGNSWALLTGQTVVTVVLSTTLTAHVVVYRQIFTIRETESGSTQARVCLVKASDSKESTNLAFGKNVSQSTTEWGPPEFAIDGCDNTTFSSRCCSKTRNDGFGPWWNIDLGNITAINRIVLTLRWGCEPCRKFMRGFRVFLTNSEDTTGASPVYISPSTVTEPGPVVTIPLDWQTGR